MWNDFVEAFGFRFDKKKKFPKASLFVSELKTWVEWHEKAAKHRVYLTAALVGVVYFLAGALVGMLL